MNTSYYEMTVPLFQKNLRNLKAIVAKGGEHAARVGMSERDVLQSRLAPDMFPLVKQIQVATDNAKGATARLAGVVPMKVADDETTVAQLIARIETIEAYLATFTPEQFTDATTRPITLPYFPNQFILGHDYVTEYALANFFFHMNMVYAILRMLGTPLGKGDYIGSMSMHELVA